MGTPFSKEMFLELFKEIDSDGSGVIDKKEMKVLMLKLMKNTSFKNLEDVNDTTSVNFAPLGKSKTMGGKPRKLPPLSQKPAGPPIKQPSFKMPKLSMAKGADNSSVAPTPEN